MIDRSTSVQDDDESGGVANGVALLAEFAACIVDELDSWDDNVGLDRIRVAAINFATKATVEFTFNSNLEANADTNASGIRHTRTADDIVAALSQIKYDKNPRRPHRDKPPPWTPSFDGADERCSLWLPW